jgi:outer membrane protein
MRHWHRFVGVACVLGGGLAAAPSPADTTRAADAASLDPARPTRTLTMAQALDYAHVHEPTIRAALARVSARLADARVPSAQWLPTAGVTGQIFAMTANNTTATYVQPAYVDLPRVGATSAVSTGRFSPYASTLVAVGLSQEVFDFGRIGAQRAAADAAVETERHRADGARLDVDFAVEEAFYSVLAAKAVVKASEDAYERSRVHRDLARRAVDSGLRSPIELTRAEADLDRFDVGRVRARGGVAVAESVLSAAIGAPDGAVDAAGEPPQPGDMPALPDALRLAQARDPRLAEALAELKAAEERTRAIGAGLRPNVSITATLSGRAGGAPPSSGVAAADDGWVPNVPNWDAGLVLVWPLLDATISARRDASRAAEAVQRSEVSLAEEHQVAAVRKAYVELEVANTALAALRNEVTAGRANYEQADARFGAGIGNAVELADAEAVRTDAEIQLALGQFEVARARATFGRAIAEGL